MEGRNGKGRDFKKKRDLCFLYALPLGAGEFIRLGSICSGRGR